MKTVHLLIPGACVNIVCDMYELTYNGEFVAWFHSFNAALEYAYAEFYTPDNVTPHLPPPPPLTDEDLP